MALAFYQSSRMPWWPAAKSPNEVDTVQIGDYGKDLDGGVGPAGEFGIRWHDLSKNKPYDYARLEVFEDAFACLATPQGAALVAWLVSQHKQNPTPEAVCRFLLSVGCADHSERPL